MLEYKNPEGYANLTPYHSPADKGKYRPVVYICSAYSGDMENKKYWYLTPMFHQSNTPPMHYNFTLN